MSQEPVKLAFSGCGGIARRHVKAMKDLVNRGRTGFTVTAVCDSNVDAAQNLAEELHEMLGMTPRPPRFVQNFLTGGRDIASAFAAYAAAVRDGSFPQPGHGFD